MGPESLVAFRCRHDLIRQAPLNMDRQVLICFAFFQIDAEDGHFWNPFVDSSRDERSRSALIFYGETLRAQQIYVRSIARFPAI